MRCCGWIMLAASCLIVQGCASPKYSQELEGGKVEFQQGHYKIAFHRLLPIAVKGKAEAQYAVGYMYYYGYGVTQDSESGLFWMHCAAEQDYAPAIKALNIIYCRIPPIPSALSTPAIDVPPHPDSKQWVPGQRTAVAPASSAMSQNTPASNPLAPVNVATNESSSQPSRDALLQALPQASSTPSLPVENNSPKLASASPLPSGQLSSDTQPIASPVVQTTPGQFSLQLYGAYTLPDVKQLQSQLKLSSTSHIYRTQNKGKEWYVLTFGSFVTANKATATKQNLPDDLRDLHPWVRKIDALVMV